MKKTVTEQMQAQRADALEKVKGAFWNDEDPSNIARIALAGGLTEAEVGNIEGEITGAKAKLHELNSFDLTAIKSTVTAAQNAYRKADAVLKKAEQARDTAADDLDNASAIQAQAKVAHESAATDTAQKKIPLDRVPDQVKRIVEFRQAAEVVSLVDGRIISAKAQQRRLQPELETLDSRLKLLQKTKEGETAVIPSAGGVVKEVDAIRARLKTVKKEMADLEKAQEAAETELPKAQEAARQAQAAIGI